MGMVSHLCECVTVMLVIWQVVLFAFRGEGGVFSDVVIGLSVRIKDGWLKTYQQSEYV